MGYAYTYSVNGSDVDPSDRYSFESNWLARMEKEGVDERYLAHVAEDAAKNYHSEHDGWEASWPVTFSIFDEAGAHLGDVEVEREYDPVFSGTVVRKEDI